ncbi:glycosyl hydrolase family 28 protein [Arachidicoccus terrestris]|uniref:glycosyl hydrolase family 28 protein n=1 Tax=Arachidicoccus terrestris TaxID=2875539 RepID=UPI001CC6FB36|nr:glycoside hydrolase family 28 protein [Arachidicoccus terrestris]UAY53797.1 glycoside hydrolase family 28 protein [Arachidicoccus terrestris]
MMKIIAFLTSFVLTFQASAAVQKPVNLTLAPGTVRSTGASFIWDKPEQYDDIKTYHLFLNSKEIATSDKCNFRLTELKPATSYSFYVKAETNTGIFSEASNAVSFSTRAEGAVLNIEDFGAIGDNKTLNTKAIQKAIDQCPVGGTVLVPAGTFLSGAIFLKSNMTLRIAEGGVLQGSGNVADYLPMIDNRFEGWEMKTYASLVNAGVMNHKGGFSVENLSIIGKGTIRGAGGALGAAMRKESGIRSRGRLILLMNCKNVDLQGLHIENPPCWTIHYLYCQGVTLHDLMIHSTAPNGDGIDPDSSVDSYIFNCSFSTGDDCIAIKSGKNPEGYEIGRPTKGVRITECNFIKGHGISIGSEMSGGVSDVVVRDCQAGPLLHGFQIKATKQRGGYVRNVRVMDCQLQKITVYSSVNYNNDGKAAPVVPVFENYLFKNIDLTTAPVNKPVIDINGFAEDGHALKNVRFENVRLPEKAEISVTDGKNIRFENVKTVSGKKAIYKITDCERIEY